MNLADAIKFVVDQTILENSESALRSAGRDGNEAFVLWVGVLEGSTFRVVDTLIPRQHPLRSEYGLCVMVEGAELGRINRWLYESGLTIGAQVHSHPSEAFHSSTDDAYPLATIEGSLSIVAADFCNENLIGGRSAIFRLVGSEWVESNWEIVGMDKADGIS